MKPFTNIFGTKIENKPFFHSACNVWRVARYEDGEIDISYENLGFKTYEDCLRECNK
jgi:hypothetical protein